MVPLQDIVEEFQRYSAIIYRSGKSSEEITELLKKNGAKIVSRPSAVAIGLAVADEAVLAMVLRLKAISDKQKGHLVVTLHAVSAL